MVHLMFVHYTFSSVGLLSGHLLGNSCPLEWSCVLIVFHLFVIKFISILFWERIWFLIAQTPVHCFLATPMFQSSVLQIKENMKGTYLATWWLGAKSNNWKQKFHAHTHGYTMMVDHIQFDNHIFAHTVSHCMCALGHTSSQAWSYEPRREKTAFLHMRNKDADQLRGDREADQRLCFRYMDRTTPLLSKSEMSSP